MIESDDVGIRKQIFARYPGNLSEGVMREQKAEREGM